MKKKNQAKNSVIPTKESFPDVTIPIKKFVLPSTISEIKNDYDDKEYSQEQARVHFDFYNNTECKLHTYRDKVYFTKLIGEFKKFNQSTIHQVNQRANDRIKNRDNSCYSKIAEGLPPDFDLLENYLHGGSRIFYAIVRDRVLIIAVTKEHPDKNKK